MKKQFVLFATVALASATMVHAQNVTSQDASAIPENVDTEGVQLEQGIQIEEPSGTEPNAGLQVPGVESEAAGAQVEPEKTVTISQTYTNQQNAITIIGTVDHAEDKQKVEQSLQQALPGKEINNQLKVAAEPGQQVLEPSGAERPETQKQEQPDDSALDAQPETERKFDVEAESQSQP